VLEAKPIKHVALGATAAPCVLEKPSHMTQVLRQAAVGASELTLLFHPMKIILKAKAPEIDAGSDALKSRDDFADRASNVYDRLRGLASDLVYAAQVSFDQRI
jgi:hypothetical protein